ncbi:hypothetical protein FACS1894111_06890 [Clostridia bacterium]|nr:hypothetical protein FACS1894111_06890 [Clostridia bacterium]
MNAVKERIIGVVDLMTESDAEAIWDMIKGMYTTQRRKWDNIEAEEPDDIDLQMLKEIETDPDCKEFVSSQEMYEALGMR